MRDLFLLDPDVVFLNHGSYGACPREVFEAQQRWQREMERNPVAFLGRRSAALLEGARSKLGAALGASGDHMVFVPNATTAVNIVAQSFPLAAGDEVLTTNLEYGACDAAWEHVCAKQGARYRRAVIPLPFARDYFVERVLAETTPKTRLIFVSHITSTTALILPIAALCRAARERGIATLIDGAHAPGQIPLNIDEIGADYYVGNCHKWLCAPKGAGFLHARPEHHSLLEPTVISWGYAAGIDGQRAFDAYLGHSLFERRMQWQGTRDIAAWLAVPQALDFQATHDWAAVRARCHELARMALRSLTDRFGLAPIAQDDDWAQMVAIPVPSQDADTLRRRLYGESNIEIPATTHAGQVFIRLSVQGYNTPHDVERLLAAPALR